MTIPTRQLSIPCHSRRPRCASTPSHADSTDTSTPPSCHHCCNRVVARCCSTLTSWTSKHYPSAIVGQCGTGGTAMARPHRRGWCERCHSNLKCRHSNVAGRGCDGSKCWFDWTHRSRHATAERCRERCELLVQRARGASSRDHGDTSSVGSVAGSLDVCVGTVSTDDSVEIISAGSADVCSETVAIDYIRAESADVCVGATATTGHCSESTGSLDVCVGTLTADRPNIELESSARRNERTCTADVGVSAVTTATATASTNTDTLTLLNLALERMRLPWTLGEAITPQTRRSFSPLVAAQNLMPHAALGLQPWNRLLSGIPLQDKNALDLACKLPLTLKALQCGASTDRVFMDTAQSTGHAGTDDGAFLQSPEEGHEGPQRLVYFEVKGAKVRTGKERTFEFKGIRAHKTQWQWLFFVGRERDPVSWDDMGEIDRCFWLGCVQRSAFLSAVNAAGRDVEKAHAATVTPGLTSSWLGASVEWSRFSVLSRLVGPVGWKQMLAT